MKTMGPIIMLLLSTNLFAQRNKLDKKPIFGWEIQAGLRIDHGTGEPIYGHSFDAGVFREQRIINKFFTTLNFHLRYRNWNSAAIIITDKYLSDTTTIVDFFDVNTKYYGISASLGLKYKILEKVNYDFYLLIAYNQNLWIRENSRIEYLYTRYDGMEDYDDEIRSDFEPLTPYRDRFTRKYECALGCRWKRSYYEVTLGNNSEGGVLIFGIRYRRNL